MSDTAAQKECERLRTLPCAMCDLLRVRVRNEAFWHRYYERRVVELEAFLRARGIEPPAPGPPPPAG